MPNMAEDEPRVVNAIADETRRCVHLDGNWSALTGRTQDEALGHGRLPIEGFSTGAVAGTATSARAAAGPRVLVIDDNRDVADSLVLLMRSFDCTVEAAYDGESGVEAAKAFRPDLAFIDLRMPGIDGYETARRIRALSVDSRPTLVALSGLGPEKAHALSEAGFDLQLIKPVGMDEIAKVIARSAR